MSRTVLEHMAIYPSLTKMTQEGINSLFFTTGARIHAYQSRNMRVISREILEPGQIMQIAKEFCSQDTLEELSRQREVSFNVLVRKVGRFRIHLYFQRDELSMVVHHVKHQIPSMEQVGLPPVLKKLVQKKGGGIILFIGSASAGITTSMAALTDYRVKETSGNVMTLEDPIQYIFKHGQSIVGQRELGTDALDFASSVREIPNELVDLFMLNTQLDEEKWRKVLSLAESGIMVMTRFTSSNVIRSIDRISSLIPKEEQEMHRGAFSSSLLAIVGQRLIPGQSVGKYHLATEVLVNTPYVSGLIMKSRWQDIHEAMEKSSDQGMHTFAQSIKRLYASGHISKEQALESIGVDTDIRWQFNLSDQSHAMRSNVSFGKASQETIFSEGSKMEEASKEPVDENLPVLSEVSS